MAKYVADAVDIPVACDVDTCFGGIFHVERAVSELCRAGLAGIRIEDQPFIGKRFGGMIGKEVIPIGEAVAKYRVAIDTRDRYDPDFQIIARCEALTASNSKGMSETIERLKAYKAAGVDVLHIEGPRSVEEVKQIRAEVDGPLTANFYNLPRGDHAGAGAGDRPLRVALPGHALERDAHRGLGPPHRFQRDGYQGVLDYYKLFPDRLDTRSLDVSGTKHIREMEEKYLPAELLAKYDVVPEGAGIVQGEAELHKSYTPGMKTAIHCRTSSFIRLSKSCIELVGLAGSLVRRASRIRARTPLKMR